MNLLNDLIGHCHQPSYGMMYARQLTSRMYINGGATTKDGRDEASDLSPTYDVFNKSQYDCGSELSSARMISVPGLGESEGGLRISCRYL